MKPILLQFSGINSFSEHTIIDFEALSGNGIFGIFGETGSGKSTVLDCINFALYGNVERSREKTDIINYKSRSANVTFTFSVLHDGKNVVYTINRVLKKDKSGTHKAELYERVGEKEECIADKATAVESKITEILGVNAEDFRKCIALPQGEFSQFVKAAPRERLALIERLFSLSRYGDRLKDRISARQAETDGRYQNVSGRLESYSDVSEESAAELAERLSKAEAELKKREGELSDLSEKCRKLNALDEKRRELLNTQSQMRELEKRKPEMTELKKRLGVIPVCKELVKASAQADEWRAKLAALKRDTDALAAQADREEINAQKATERLARGNFDERIAECLKTEANYASAGGKPEKLKALQAQLRQKREEYRALDEEKKRLEVRLRAAQSEVVSAEEAVGKQADVGVDGILDDSFKGAILKSEYVYSLDWFSRFKGDLSQFDDDTPLYDFVSAEVAKKINEYKLRISDVRDFDVRAANKKLEQLKNNADERRRLYNALADKRRALQNIESELAINAHKAEAAIRDGGELKARVDELEAELKQLFGESGADIQTLRAANAELLNSLNEQKKSAQSEAERAKDSLTRIKIDAERLGALQLSATDRLGEAERCVRTLLCESSFESVEECKSFLGGFGDYENAEQNLGAYEARYASTAAKLAELEAIEHIKDYREEELRSALNEKSEAETAVRSLTGEIAVMQSDKKTGERRLREKQDILKELKSVVSERELVARLKEATKNNKFLEYIATEYLMDISALASETLLTLTDGRYYLVYKNNNFQVSDNYDSGNFRGVNTLSGGETFLVSLSLALALSQTICAKSNKIIEFFFLDEGFGTLDSNLVDTVMNALEKLKSSHFTIGVISHVEELKHRIESKITVNKATESHGSTVSISY